VRVGQRVNLTHTFALRLCPAFAWWGNPGHGASASLYQLPLYGQAAQRSPAPALAAELTLKLGQYLAKQSLLPIHCGQTDQGLSVSSK
jgi:hypothetical protein